MEIKTSKEAIMDITLLAIPKTENGARTVTVAKDRVVSCGAMEVILDFSDGSDSEVNAVANVLATHGQESDAFRLGEAQDKCSLSEVTISVK